MPTFVTLSRDNSGDPIHVNMDMIIQIERNPTGNYTVLTTGNKDRPAVTVSETPDRILTLLLHQRRE